MMVTKRLAHNAPEEPDSNQVLLDIIRRRRAACLSTKVHDLLEDPEGGIAVCQSIEIARQQKAFEALQRAERAENSEPAKSDSKSEGTYECLLSTKVLTRPLQVVVDTGASHSIVACRSVRKLKLKGLIQPSKKVFITAAGELSFPCWRD